MASSSSTASAVKINLPLSYQQDIFHEVRSNDRLVIMARGLGLLRVVSNLLHSYDAAGDNLVILVGADERENEWIGEALAEQAAISKTPKAKGLRIVNTDASTVSSRQKMYATGGIFSVTSRILVVDLLTDLISPENITGLVVLHSERIIATSLEAFILRIFRQKNKDGFIKAFSDSPEPFTTGFAPLAAMMRNLFLRTPSLYPRFHLTVADSLESKKAEVVELSVDMTDSMSDIQQALLHCIEISISELRKLNGRELEMDEWSVDSALHRNFDIIMRRQLDPIWHRVSRKTRQIVGDLTTLRTMLNYLLAYDCVQYNQYLEMILASNSPGPGMSRLTQSPWLFLDAAQVVFKRAKERVYKGKVTAAISKPGTKAEPLVPVLEEQPKWEVLSKVLEEIERDVHMNPSVIDDSYGTTLIMCADEATCRQIREYVQAKDVSDVQEDIPGAKPVKSTTAAMMRRKLRAYMAWKRGFAMMKSNLTESKDSATDQNHSKNSYRGRAPPNKRRRVRGGASVAAGPSRSASGYIQIEDDSPQQVSELLNDVQERAEESLKPEIAVDPLEGIEGFYEPFEMKNLVIVHPYDGDMDDQLLEELRPRHVIMYSPDTAFVRRVEVYRSSHRDRQIKCYLLYYTDSVEEQRFLSAVRKEKDAFSKLIREKGTMTVTLTTAEVDPQEQFLRTVNTRIAGGGRLTATVEPPRVIVDIREFRSSLPSLLHGRHMTVVPCMLTVGDYILSPEICVERKSVKDLIASFNNGRLYTQCETMVQFYKFPMVLIEFDQNKSFNLEPFADLTSTISGNDLQSKLVLLILAFPKLKLIWSSSPYQTAEIFEELKKNQDEPDPIKAVQVGLGEGEDPTTTYNQTPQDMLRAVPGINLKNSRLVMADVENIQELAGMKEAEIAKLIGKEAAKKVWAFFHKNALKAG